MSDRLMTCASGGQENSQMNGACLSKRADIQDFLAPTQSYSASESVWNGTKAEKMGEGLMAGSTIYETRESIKIPSND